MHWVVELEQPDGTWFALCHCTTVEHAAECVRILLSPTVSVARTIRVTRIPCPPPIGTL